MTVRKSDVEAGIMERSVYKGKSNYIPPSCESLHMKAFPSGLRHEEHDESRDGESDASKQHLASCHICGNAEF